MSFLRRRKSDEKRRQEIYKRWPSFDPAWQKAHPEEHAKLQDACAKGYYYFPPSLEKPKGENDVLQNAL
jgi:hypothetical protein